MSEHDRRTDWTIVGAVALIVAGVWLLMGRIGGPWWGAVNRFMGLVATLAWPLALIAAGVLLLVAGRKGGVGQGAKAGKRLYRSRTERMVGGVLGGIATYLGVDPTWVRITYVVLAVLTSFGPALLVYIIAMVIVPEEPKSGQVDPPVWPQPEPQGTETVQVPPPAPPIPESPQSAPPAPEPPQSAPPAPEPPQSAPPAPPAPPQG